MPVALPPGDIAENRYVSNGAAGQQFTGEFHIDDASEVDVYYANELQVLYVDYSVTITPNSNTFMVTAITTPANAVPVTLLRGQALEQTSQYQRNENFPALRIQRDLDDLTKIAQQLRELIARALLFQPQSLLSDKKIDEPTEGLFARWKVGGGIDWASVTSAGEITIPVPIAQGGTGATNLPNIQSTLFGPLTSDGEVLTADSTTPTGIVYKPLPFRIVPLSAAASGTANRTALVNAIAALPATGGRLEMPAGTFAIDTSTIVFDRPVTLVGSGPRTTVLARATPSANPVFTVSCNNPCNFYDFEIQMAGTIDTGVLVDSAGSAQSNLGTQISNVTIIGGAYGIHFQRAAGWSVRDHCYLANQTVSSILVENIATVVQDAGDSIIQDVLFELTTIPDAKGVTWVGSGGMRIMSCKFLGNDAGTASVAILLQPATGVNTTIIMIGGGTSIENFNFGILGSNSTVGQLGHIIIDHVHMGDCDGGFITFAHANFYSIQISNVIMQSAVVQQFITLVAGVDISVNDCKFRGAAGASVGISVSVGALNVNIGSGNTFLAAGLPVANSSTSCTIHMVGPGVTAGQLPAIAADGSLVYVDGVGFRHRLGGVWTTI